MKEIILVTSFGSTVDSARENQIFPVVDAIRKANPSHEVRRLHHVLSLSV